MKNLNKSLLTLLLGTMFLTSCFRAKEKELPYIESKIVHDTIFSESLKEKRAITTYLPKTYLKTKAYPVIYAADGQIIVESYKKVLDSLIAKNQVKPFILVGVHSNEKEIDGGPLQYRNFEYKKGEFHENDTVLNRRYRDHYSFFTKEVLEFIEDKYAVSKKSNDRFFYGMSNGAELGVSIGVENPNIFKTYICFSLTGGDFKNVNWTRSNYPFFYLSYGNKEPLPLIIKAIEFEEFLTANNYNHEQSIFEGSHNREMWKKEFAKVLKRILKKEIED